MKYTKDNINGVKFQYNGKGTVYTIDLERKTGSNIFWEPNYYTHYELDSITNYLNRKDWVVVEEVIPETYQIY